MATTSGNLTAGTAIAGRGGDSRGKKGRVAGLVATVTLGFGLLSGLGFGQLSHRAPSASAAAWYNPPRSVIITGETPCALGGTAPCGHFNNESAGITPIVVGVFTEDEAGGVYADALGVGVAQSR